MDNLSDYVFATITSSITVCFIAIIYTLTYFYRINTAVTYQICRIGYNA